MRGVVLYNDDSANTLDGPAVDMRTVRGGGQLLLAWPLAEGGNGTPSFQIQQAPTAAGPWSDVPNLPTLNVEVSTGAGSFLSGYSRSMRFVRGEATAGGNSSFPFSAFLVEPPPPLFLS